MLLERLRTETASAHLRLETRLALTDPGLTMPRYTRLVRRFHAFHAVWEPQMAGILADEAFFGPRRRLDLLARDLRHFGLAAEPAPQRRIDLPADLPSALGSLYVMEGSTLGGRIIARHLARSLGLSPATGCAYFDAYGAAVGPMWVAFRAQLRVRTAGMAPSDVIAGAAATFASLEDWLCGDDTDRVRAA